MTALSAPGLDVRLHAPRPQVVLAYVTGTVDESTIAVFTERITAAFGSALHVVVDLSEVTALARAGIRALLDLDRAATRYGTQLHVTGSAHPYTSHHIAGHLLRRLGADHLLELVGPPDAVR